VEGFSRRENSQEVLKGSKIKGAGYSCFCSGRYFKSKKRQGPERCKGKGFVCMGKKDVAGGGHVSRWGGWGEGGGTGNMGGVSGATICVVVIRKLKFTGSQFKGKRNRGRKYIIHKEK